MSNQWHKTLDYVYPERGTLLHGLYGYVQPQSVWFLAILVINRVIGDGFSTLALHWVCFPLFLGKATFSKFLISSSPKALPNFFNIVLS